MQLKSLKYQLEFENSINHTLEICRFSQRKPQLLLNQMYKKAKKRAQYGPIFVYQIVIQVKLFVIIVEVPIALDLINLRIKQLPI